MAIIDSATAKIFKNSIRTLQQDVHREFHRDTYVLLEIHREAGTWDQGGSNERYVVRGTGRCKLYGSGVGGPRFADIVSPQSPYQIRVLASEFVTDGQPILEVTGMLIVINGERVFQVDDLKVDGEGDLLADLYLTERIGEDVPVYEVEP